MRFLFIDFLKKINVLLYNSIEEEPRWERYNLYFEK